MQANLEQCPLCGTELSQTKFREIRAKLREQDDQKARELEDAKLAIKGDAEREYSQKLAQESREAEKRARAEAHKQLEKALAEKDGLADKLRTAEAQVAEIRKKAQADIEKQKQIAETTARAQFEQQLKKLASERDQVTSERDQAAKKLKQAEAEKQVREAAIRKEAQEGAEKVWRKELGTQRQALEKDKTDALLKQQSEHNRERESYQKKLKVMEQQLQRKTANELGDSGEIDVFDALRDTFQGDRITRIPKGQAGADILHEVVYKGESCGRIITDAKNRQVWHDAYVTKTRKDKADAKAEHAIIATTVFPATKKNLCIESDVIVCLPGLVVHITGLLRQAMITMHIKDLGLTERSNKMSQLYKLITSESYRKRFAEAEKLAQDVLDLDTEEKEGHDRVWRKRGMIATRIKGVLRDLTIDVAAVIERVDAAPPVRLETPKGASLRPSDFADATQQEFGSFTDLD